MNTYNVIGLMSGTSLDGIDIAYCKFHEVEGKWDFEILIAETVSYSEEWKKRLSSLIEAKPDELVKTDIEYAYLTADIVNAFISIHQIIPDLISSHGHTVFHEPSRKRTLQIGNGAVIAEKTGINVAYDFRRVDVDIGGQGAPLVPVGDRLLFPEYDYCLNLGGFSNISFEKGNNRIAFDICPVNIILNLFSEKKGIPYDNNGDIAKSGSLNKLLLRDLNNIEYYFNPPPKSLGKEWLSGIFIPIVEKYDIPIEDKLRTLTEHISFQIAKILNFYKKNNVLVTGGGVYNSFLINLIKQKTKVEIIIPQAEIVEYKEALIFGLLGILRMRNEINCLSSVTGAREDSCSGKIIIQNEG